MTAANAAASDSSPSQTGRPKFVGPQNCPDSTFTRDHRVRSDTAAVAQLRQRLLGVGERDRADRRVDARNGPRRERTAIAEKSRPNALACAGPRSAPLSLRA